MNMIRNGQIQEVARGDIEAQIKFIDELFDIAA